MPNLYCLCQEAKTGSSFYPLARQWSEAQRHNDWQLSTESSFCNGQIQCKWRHADSRLNQYMYTGHKVRNHSCNSRLPSDIIIGNNQWLRVVFKKIYKWPCQKILLLDYCIKSTNTVGNAPRFTEKTLFGSLYDITALGQLTELSELKSQHFRQTPPWCNVNSHFKTDHWKGKLELSWHQNKLLNLYSKSDGRRTSVNGTTWNINDKGFHLRPDHYQLAM